MKFALGREVKDSVTGFSGVVTSRADYLSGSEPRYEVSPRVVGGTPVDPRWIDESRLAETEAPKEGE